MSNGVTGFYRDSRGNDWPYTSRSTGIIAASGAIKASYGILVDLLVYTDGNNDATAILYDNSSGATGTELAKMVVKGSDLVGGEVNIMVEASNGIYLSLTGTGASVLVRYA